MNLPEQGSQRLVPGRVPKLGQAMERPVRTLPLLVRMGGNRAVRLSMVQQCCGHGLPVESAGGPARRAGRPSREYLFGVHSPSTPHDLSVVTPRMSLQRACELATELEQADGEYRRSCGTRHRGLESRRCMFASRHPDRDRRRSSSRDVEAVADSGGESSCVCRQRVGGSRVDLAAGESDYT